MNIPEKGFYYHYKHNPSGEFSNYAYEVLGTTRDSETKEYGVLYRPLYENTYLAEADFTVRPLQMFMEDVEIHGVRMPRFQKITDSNLIAQLEEIKSKLYG